MTDQILELTNVRKSYSRGRQVTEVLAGVSLRAKTGEFLALMGPSGSGKTTLLNILSGLDIASGGEIRVAGSRLDFMSTGQRTKWRAATIGFVFQSYNLMAGLTAGENVELPLFLTRLGRSERLRRVGIALELVGLKGQAGYRLYELSGGQQQRVAIARAIVAECAILICDEPTGDLDRLAANDILDLLRLLNREEGKTIVMVTHDPVAAGFADRLLRLDKGVLLTESKTAPQ